MTFCARDPSKNRVKLFPSFIQRLIAILRFQMARKYNFLLVPRMEQWILNKFPRPAEDYHDDLHLRREKRTNVQKRGEGVRDGHAWN